MTKVTAQAPSTWRKYSGPAMCQGCHGLCCTLPVEVSVSDLIRLGLTNEDEASESLKKLFKRLHKEGFVKSFHPTRMLFVLEQQAHEECVFLDVKSRLCKVYDRRPEVCRQFPKIGPRPGYCPSLKKEPKK